MALNKNNIWVCSSGMGYRPQNVIEHCIDGSTQRWTRLIPTGYWEYADNEKELFAKLDGDMAEVTMPARSFLVRVWLGLREKLRMR